MKKLVLFFIVALVSNYCFSQNFKGQWKGTFVDNSAVISWGSNKCDYVIDLDVTGSEISGYSYTYYNEDGKKYYTICTLKGTYDAKKKYIEVTETARTKTNVPYNVENSFQLHKLRWRKEADKEILEGNWVPAPGQKTKNMGFGNTILTKRALTEIYPTTKKIKQNNNPLIAQKHRVLASVKPKQQSLLPKKTEQKTIAKTLTRAKQKPILKQVLKQQIKPVTDAPKKDSEVKVIANNSVKFTQEKLFSSGFEKRSSSIIQTINVENRTVSVELYDNGDIDGDSVSLFYNGKALLTHKKLTTNPLYIEIEVNNEDTNELVMYADNLGSIPPNTALMIIMDGKKRYEVRVTSDLKKSGTIRFVRDKKE